MNVLGLDGRSYRWDLSDLTPFCSEVQGRSAGHLAARTLLETLFPADRRLEEVPLPGTGGLRADFYLPARRLVVEVQGRQHDEFVPHFHGDYFGFLRARRNDHNKARWCSTNGLFLAELACDTEEQWRDVILAAVRGEPNR